MTARWFDAAVLLATAVTVLFLALPVAALLTHSPPGELLEALGDHSARRALLLSAETSGVALLAIVLFGTPAAWLLARSRFPGRAVVSTLLELPLVLPPAVAGLALLVSLGPGGLLGLDLPFHTAAVVVALVFVSAPFHIRQAQAAFEALDPALIDASRTLGASPARTFLLVAVPACSGALITGAALALARALGEFGATLMFAGSLEGVTRTASLAVYDRFGTDLDGALALSAVMVAAAATLLVGVRAAGARSAGR